MSDNLENFGLDFMERFDNSPSFGNTPGYTGPAPLPTPGRTGGGGGTSLDFDSLLSAGLDESMNAHLQRYSDLNKPGNVTYSDPYLTDTFTSQKIYNPEGFDPRDYQGNTSRYTAAETWGSAWGKAFDDLGYKFKNSFGEYWQSYTRIGKALLNADLDMLELEEDDLMRMYSEDQKAFKRNHIFQTEEEDDSFFNKEFLRDFIGNAGFTLGTFSGVLLELTAELAIATATGGLAAPAAGTAAAGTLGRLGTKLAQLGKGLKMGDMTAEAIKQSRLALRTTDELNTVGKFVRAGNKQGQNLIAEVLRLFSVNYKDLARAEGLHLKMMKVLEQTPVIGSIARTGRKYKAASDIGLPGLTKAGIGLQGFRRSLAEFNLASSEAAFEAVSSYGDSLDKMIARYKEDNGGLFPDGNEIHRMKELAMSASSANYNTNTAILLASNKLQFGNIFNRFQIANKALKEFMDETATRAILVSSGKKALGKEIKGEVFQTDGMFGVYGELFNISNKFGRKEALKQMTKAFSKDFLKFEVTEGFQENLQETSAHAWTDYYTKAYSHEPRSVFHSVQDGLKEQISEQGLKVFLMGALTGSIVRVPMQTANLALEGLQSASYKVRGVTNPITEEKNQLAKDIADINKTLAGLPDKLFSEQLLNFKAQQGYSQDMTAAAANNSIYEYNNGRENALLSSIKMHKRLNTLDAYRGFIEEMGEYYTDEQFAEAYGVDIKNTEYGSVQQFTKKIADDIKTYAKVMDEAEMKAAELVNPLDYQKGSVGEYMAMMEYGVLVDAAEIIAFNQIKGSNASRRAGELADKLRSIPGVSGSSDLAIRVLTDRFNVDSELEIITAEASSLEKDISTTTDRTTKADLNEQLKLKKAEIKALQDWRQYYPKKTVIDPQTNETFEVDDIDGRFQPKGNTKAQQGKSKQKIARLFTEIINIKNKQAGIKIEVSQQDIKDSVDYIIDYNALTQDAIDYRNVVDALTNQDAFRAMLSRMLTGKIKAGIRKTIENVQEASKETRKMVLQNSMGMNLMPQSWTNFIESVLDETHPIIKKLLTIYHDRKSGNQNYAYINNLLLDLAEDYRVTFGLPKEEESQGEQSLEKKEEETEKTVVAKEDDEEKVEVVPGTAAKAAPEKIASIISSDTLLSTETITGTTIEVPGSIGFLRTELTRVSREEMVKGQPEQVYSYIVNVIVDPQDIDGLLDEFNDMGIEYKVSDETTAREMYLKDLPKLQADVLNRLSVALEAQGLPLESFGDPNVADTSPEAVATAKDASEVGGQKVDPTKFMSGNKATLKEEKIPEVKPDVKPEPTEQPEQSKTRRAYELLQEEEDLVPDIYQVNEGIDDQGNVTGPQVIDDADKVVENSKNSEEAQKRAEELNKSKANNDYFSMLAKNVPEDRRTEFTDALSNALNTHNERNNTNTSAEEFFKSAANQKKINDLYKEINNEAIEDAVVVVEDLPESTTKPSKEVNVEEVKNASKNVEETPSETSKVQATDSIDNTIIDDMGDISDEIGDC